jgi:hypothetical protein
MNGNQLCGGVTNRWELLVSIMPSESSRMVTAAAFEISEDSVERLCKERAPIPLSTPDTEAAFLIGQPIFSLLDFPEVNRVWETVSR